MDSITLSHRGKSHADKVHPHERVVTYCHCLLWSMDSTQVDFENSSLTLLTLDSGSADHTIVFFFFTFYYASFTFAIELIRRFPSRLIQLCATHILDMMRCYTYKYILLEMRGWKWFYNQLQLRLISLKCTFEMQYVILQKERCSKLQM